MKKYINEFFRLNCAPQLLMYKLFPNVKEITESLGAFNAVRNVVMNKTNIKFDDPLITIVCVGDGFVPRTAATFAMRSKWYCYSVDPNLRMKEYPIKRLVQVNKKIEDIDLNFSNSIVIIVAVHSHAKVEDMLNHIIGKERHFVTIPCCVPHEINNKEYIGYFDENIWSEKNTVKIWMNI